jgi:hypothetical protein
VVLCEHIAEPHFTTLETAELLGIERRTVDYWIYTKKLPIRLIEGRNYIRLCDLEKILYEGSASIEREKNRRLKESAKLKKHRDPSTHKKFKTASNSSDYKST